MIFLTGMMGSGKTFFGAKLAETLGVSHFDTDEEVEKLVGRSINEIFKGCGSEAFRTLESRALDIVCEKDQKSVISTGGGIILDYNNVLKMKSHGIIIFLNRSPEDIISDIDVSNRPLIKNDKSVIFEIYEQRIGLYKKYADFEVLSKDRDTTFSQLLDYINKGGLI